MRALVLKQRDVSFHADYPSPRPAEGEVPVRVLMAGICETDLQLMRGYMGFAGVLGHEFVGIVEDGPWTGRRVVGEINCSCHRCETCLRGLSTHCPNRTVLGILGHDGAFADVVCVPQRNLHAVPDHLDNATAVFAEPLAAAFQIPAQIPLVSGLRAVVLGDGRLGILCGQVLRNAGCDVSLVGKHAAKLEIAREVGLTASPVDAARPDRGADLVVDCTGSETGLSAALAWVRPRGTVVLKTTVASPHRLSLAPLVIDEVTLVGSRCGPFPEALEALADGKIRVDPLISRIVPLEDGPAALRDSAGSGMLKTLLEVRSG